MVISNHSSAGLQWKRREAERNANTQRRKGKPELLNIAAEACTEGEKEIEEEPDLYWKKGRGTLGARAHPANLPTCGRKMLESFSASAEE